MKAIRFEQFGEPSEVLKAVEFPDPEPGPGEIRVRMIASPINPSDILTIRGLYGVRPELPFTPGYEGVGVVEKAGSGLVGKALVGRRVAVLSQGGGNWAEKTIIPALRVVPVSSDLPDEQVASFFVNPATVLAMVRHVLKVPKGAWLLQSAAGSTLGRMIIKLGQHDGFRTINVVRRHEAVAELKALGADAVIVSTDGPIDEQVRAIVGGEGVLHAIDPVGGETGTGLFDSLATDGRMLVYGTLSQSQLSIDPRKMIAGRRVLEGFYLGHWAAARNKIAMVMLFREISDLIRKGILATEPGPVFSLDAIADAARASEVVSRRGKVLLRMAR
ncbi:zinc-dependent alcohol dehydrogenase family protein [Tundrisphaera lichenicola]|uniref:zinc-dependent alcohol dehydrogenase family protein n=1 Tax=Tundrisphaera lichenicola TaxID=2029860 RepID=UPI003EC06C78